MRRGRRSDKDITAGDTLDFWRVLIANKEERRLLLYAEMKLPGEAWLEFKIDQGNNLTQSATFRPLGLLGRIYWYAVLPFHGLIFRGLTNNIIKVKKEKFAIKAENDPVPTMHDRHWVGRNRGNNLKTEAKPQVQNQLK